MLFDLGRDDSGWDQPTLQKSMLLTPLLPNAGPTGGLGLACPAPTISFTIWSVAMVLRAIQSFFVRMTGTRLRWCRLYSWEHRQIRGGSFRKCCSASSGSANGEFQTKSGFKDYPYRNRRSIVNLMSCSRFKCNRDVSAVSRAD